MGAVGTEAMERPARLPAAGSVQRDGRKPSSLDWCFYPPLCANFVGYSVEIAIGTRFLRARHTLSPKAVMPLWDEECAPAR